jgi:hypothetical protein
MTSGNCSRCGRMAEIQYGSDGLGYCSSCAFYGLNKQCWRCRMYLPASELQQYRGQYTCPYCIMDLRDADRRAEEYHEEKHKLEVLQYPETCERCGRDLEGRVYVWNGRKLCRKCLEDEQDSKWGLVGGGPMHAPQRISLKPEQRRKQTSIIENALSELFIFLRLKKRPVEEIVVYDQKMPIQRAKPMAEQPMEAKPDQQHRPQAEGIIKPKEEAPGKGAPGGKGSEPFGFEPVAAKPGITGATPKKTAGRKRRGGRKGSEPKGS